MKKIIMIVWQTLKRPSTRFSLGTLAFGSFFVGVLFWVGFNSGLKATNTEEFCLSCHEMRDNVYPELQTTIHFTNRTGVRATCPDCHVPHAFTDKLVRKLKASRELLGNFMGTIDTREKFLDQRLRLARSEWRRMKANDSKECRDCHQFDYMDFTEQSKRAAKQHSTVLASGEKTCIDCHKGIAHELPDMSNIHGWK